MEYENDKIMDTTNLGFIRTGFKLGINYMLIKFAQLVLMRIFIRRKFGTIQLMLFVPYIICIWLMNAQDVTRRYLR